MNEGKTEERKTGTKQKLRGKRVKERTNEDLSRKNEGRKRKEGNKRGDRNECRNNEDAQREAIPSVQHTGYISLSSNVQGSFSHVCS